MRDFGYKGSPENGRPLPKLKEFGWYSDHSNLLLFLQTVYFTKLSNLPEIITHLHLYKDVRIIPQGKLPRGELPLRKILFCKLRRIKFSFGFYWGLIFLQRLFQQ